MSDGVVVAGEHSVPFHPYDVEWVPESCRFAAVGMYARGSGAIQVFEIEEDGLKSVTQVEKKAAFKCLSFGLSRAPVRLLATGDFDGNVCVWNLDQPHHPSFSTKGHQTLVNAVDACGGTSRGGGAPELVSAGRDGLVRLWDIRQKEPVATIGSPENGRDCWAVAIGNTANTEDRLVCAGYDNGDVALVDLRSSSVMWQTNVGAGVCRVSFDTPDKAPSRVVATTVDGKAHVFSLTNPSAPHSIPVHDDTVWCVRHVPQDQSLFGTAAGDGSVSVWRHGESRIATTSVSERPVLSMDWCPDRMGLCVVCTLDQSIRLLQFTNLGKV